MMILDTNVVSALMRPEFNLPVVEWIDSRPQSSLWFTSISLMEIRSGLLFMPPGKRRDLLTQGFQELLGNLLDGRVLPFDGAAAEAAASIDLIQQKRGSNVGTGDIQIAGIVVSIGATLVTRNVEDFTGLDIPLVNPWTN